MAINTKGFVISQMPKYTPVDPNLVAFNPSQATNGMLDAFNLAKVYEQLKASKALQAELEATRQARIAQTNSLANLDVTKAAMQTRLTTQQEASLGSGFNFQLHQNESGIRQLPSIEAANIAKNEQTAITSPLITDAMVQQIPLDAEAKRLESISNISTSPLVFKNKVGSLLNEEQDQNLHFGAAPSLANLQITKAVEDNRTYVQENAMKNTLMASQSEHFLGQAEQARATAKAMADKTDENALGLSRIEKAVANAEKEVVSAERNHETLATKMITVEGKPPMTRNQLYSIYYNPDGTKKHGGFMGMGGELQVPGPEKSLLDDLALSAKEVVDARARREKYGNAYNGLLKKYFDNNNGSLLGPSSGTQNTVQPAQLKIGDVVTGYQYIGGNPKDQNSWKKVQ